ncbi:MAG: MBL fold metallo-hydrolase [Candidatus Lokiarchaeota archaeon]|nr:MBL fold metallo-hydrolase [Candidatus Lokiarchaeota archaeon]
MTSIKIQTLGIGAIRLSFDELICVVDAFIDDVHKLDPFDENDIDIIFITHDDGDHFSSKKVADNVKKTNAIVIGPPSITFPLLINENLPSENLKVFYHPKRFEGIKTIVKGIPISIYNTKHFLDHYPVHISFLLKINEKKIYITGDSNEITKEDPKLKNLDLIIFNFVNLEKNLSEISVIKDLIKDFSPKKILINHILNCDWTFNPTELKKEIEIQNLDNVIILENNSEILEL